MGFAWPPSPGGGCNANPDSRCAFGVDDPKFAEMPARNKHWRDYCKMLMLLLDLVACKPCLSKRVTIADGTDVGALDANSFCEKCKSPGGSGTGLQVVSLGDEIGFLQPAILGQPPFAVATNKSWRAFLAERNVSAAAVGCATLSSCNMTNIGPPSSTIPLDAAAALMPCGLPLANGCGPLTPQEGLKFYLSSIFAHNHGIEQFRNQTRIFRNGTANRTVGVSAAAPFASSFEAQSSGCTAEPRSGGQRLGNPGVHRQHARLRAGLP